MSLAAVARDVLELLDAWAPRERVSLLGHDWGAVHTYVACAVAPGRVERAVTLAAPHPLTFLAQLRRPAQLRRSWYMALFQLPGAPRLVAAGDFALVDSLWRTWSPGLTRAPADRAALHACLAASRGSPVRYYRPRPSSARLVARLARPIRTPLLQMHGGDDGCVLPPRAGDGHRYDGPHDVEVLPGLGHFLHLEAPARVAERAHAWLAR